MVVKDALPLDSNDLLQLTLVAIAGNGGNWCIPSNHQPLPQAIMVPQDSMAQKGMCRLQHHSLHGRMSHSAYGADLVQAQLPQGHTVCPGTAAIRWHLTQACATMIVTRTCLTQLVGLTNPVRGSCCKASLLPLTLQLPAAEEVGQQTGVPAASCSSKLYSPGCS